MYFHCSVYKTFKLLHVFWITSVYKRIEVFMDIFQNRIIMSYMFIKREYHKKMRFVLYFPYV